VETRKKDVVMAQKRGFRSVSLSRLVARVGAGMLVAGVGIGGCTDPTDPGNGGGNAPASLAGTVEVASLNIPAGDTVAVTADLTLRASGDITIAGDLIAEANPDGDGFDITLIADGNLTIDGTIQAGAPADPATFPESARPAPATRTAQAGGTDLPGHAGGSLNIVSERGNVTVGRNTTLIAFSGTDGVGGVRGAPGGRGGSVSICAPFGRLTMRGSIELGNGGEGGDANLDTATMAQAFPDDAVVNIFEFENAGGDSGRLFAFAASYDWPELEFYGDTVPGLGRSAALDPFAYLANPNTGLITGGIGGSAGSVFVMDDVAGQLAQRIALAAAGTPDMSFTENFRIRAAHGGRGWTAGGNGGFITVNGAGWNNRDAVEYRVTAGAGGDVTTLADPDSQCGNAVPAIGAIGGIGGSATTTSPGGIPPVTAQDSGDGGNGALALAIGGDGGDAETAVAQTGGMGGNAVASAGAGADGLGSCFAGDVGDGGKGGNATARGGDGGDGQTRGEGGIANAFAGAGGNGGNGDGFAGAGGAGGSGFSKIGSQGSTGQPGEVIETGAEFDEPGPAGAPGDPAYFDSPDVCADVDYQCPHGQLCGA
jgi:hypothetical protein